MYASCVFTDDLQSCKCHHKLWIIFIKVVTISWSWTPCLVPCLTPWDEGYRTISWPWHLAHYNLYLWTSDCVDYQCNDWFVFQIRDLKAIGSKFLHVLYPKESRVLLRECNWSSVRFVYSSSCFYWYSVAESWLKICSLYSQEIRLSCSSRVYHIRSVLFFVRERLHPEV